MSILIDRDVDSQNAGRQAVVESPSTIVNETPVETFESDEKSDDHIVQSKEGPSSIENICTPREDSKYKKHCVAMSCVLSKKAVRLKELEAENNGLKNASAHGANEFFSVAEFQKLNRVRNGKSNDMTYVRTATELIYGENLDRLLAKSVNGNKGRNFYNKDGTVVYKEKKTPLSPDKVADIRRLFHLRVQDDPERTSTFSRLMSQSLSKIQLKLVRTSNRGQSK